MQRSNGTRFIPLLITLVIVIIAVVAVVSIGRALFFGSNDSKDEATTAEMRDVGRDSLLNTNAGRGVRLTVRGPIVAEENFMSYTIAATPATRAMVVYNGYVDDIKDRKSYENNSQAYEQFVYALDKANMMKGQASDQNDNEDLRGICATGYVYEYAVTLNDESVKRLWTSTCGGSKGNLDASVDQLNDLYQKQIPDFKDLTPFRQTPFQGLKF